MVSHCIGKSRYCKYSWLFKVYNKFNDFIEVSNYTQLILRTQPQETMEKKKMILPVRLNLVIWWKTWIPTLRYALVIAVYLFIYSLYCKTPKIRWKRQEKQLLYPIDNLEAKIVVNDIPFRQQLIIVFALCSTQGIFFDDLFHVVTHKQQTWGQLDYTFSIATSGSCLPQMKCRSSWLV